MVLERTHRGNHHHGVGFKTGHAALDVHELLRAQICGEARLGDGIIAELEGKAGGHDAVAAVRDVGKGAAVDKGRGTLQRLHQIGLDGVLEERRHGALCLQIVSGDRLAVVGAANDDAAQPLLQIQDAGGEAKHRHDLAGHGDLKTVLAGNALNPAAQAVHDVAKLPVVHIHSPLPGDGLGIDAQGIPLLNMIVQHGGQQVVGSADGVEIAGKVKVDILHGHHLGVAAAGSASLDAEHGAERRLPQRYHRVLPDAAQAVGQTDRGGRLPFSGGGGRDGGDEDQFAVGAILQILQDRGIHLGLIIAVLLQILFFNTRLLRNFRDLAHLAALGDFNVSQERHVAIPFQLFRF